MNTRVIKHHCPIEGTYFTVDYQTLLGGWKPLPENANDISYIPKFDTNSEAVDFAKKRSTTKEVVWKSKKKEMTVGQAALFILLMIFIGSCLGYLMVWLFDLM